MPTKKFEIEDVYINENFNELFNQSQDVSHRILTTVPNVREMREGEILFYDNKLYTKINGILKSAVLS